MMGTKKRCILRVGEQIEQTVIDRPSLAAIGTFVKEFCGLVDPLGVANSNEQTTYHKNEMAYHTNEMNRGRTVDGNGPQNKLAQMQPNQVLLQIL